MSCQRTLAATVDCAGVGIHSGSAVRLVIAPADPGHGVVFVRREAGRAVEIPARIESVRATANATTLGRDGVSVATVEHLLAALRGLGVDNARVDVEGEELPVLDGSAAPFVELLERAGIADQDAPRREIRVLRPVVHEEGERRVRFEPADAGFSLRCTIDFAHPAIGRQSLELRELDAGSFARELAPARTFGFYDQVEALRAAGLARGASLDNTVVLDASGVMNPEGLRFPDEFVRHKALDAVGDLALLGHPIRGRVVVERGGHALHRAAAATLLADADAWEWAEGG